MRKLCYEIGESGNREQERPKSDRPEHVSAALARSLENLMAISAEASEKLAEIEDCPEPCRDGRVRVTLSSGQERRFPCPYIAPDCVCGKFMEEQLERYIAEVMFEIGVPLRHLDNFARQSWTTETAEAARWPIRGFLIFMGNMGKSFGAALVLRKYLKDQVKNRIGHRSWETARRAGSSVMWRTAAEISDDREIAARARRESLVVIDDLGGENDTPAIQAVLRGVLMKRYDMKLPTVITTALTMLDIDARYGRRVVIRLAEDIGSGGKVIVCNSVHPENPGELGSLDLRLDRARS
jgi:hypothetical protein